jgi:hypothetical protein
MEDTFLSPPHSPEAQSPGLLELSTPPLSPAPPPTPRQPILLYSQLHQPNLAEPCRGYYDPHTLFNEFPFTLEGQKEYLIIISGIGFDRRKDHHIYPLIGHTVDGPLEINPDQAPYCLCLLMKHMGPDVNLTVAARTSLAFLLENARINIQLCFISSVMEFCLRQDIENIVTASKDQPNCNYLTTYSPTGPTASSLAPPIMARNPLLLRRMQQLPKFSFMPPHPSAE